MLILELLNLRGGYFIGYSWLLGMSIWVTFFGGVIAFKALPRHQFGALQHRTFPVYFNISILLAGALASLWAYGHPGVLGHLTELKVAEVVQLYTLFSVIGVQAGNHFVVGPMTSSTMFKRQRLEKEEGKSYNDEGVSAEMKALNSRFSQLHGISSLLNLSAIVALVFHGLWIGNKGLGDL